MKLSKPLILASASPRRSELLSLAGIPFTVKVSGCDEHTDETAPERIVAALSRQKAEAVAFDLHEPCYILGSDTIVACDDEILGKPKDAEDAERMIRMISGRAHQVYTGVTLLSKSAHSAGAASCFTVRTDVHVAALSDEEIRDYIAADAVLDSRPLDQAEGLSASSLPEWKDKAGAYAIQGLFGSRFITAIEGDYYNVVGLPVGRVYQELKRLEALTR